MIEWVAGVVGAGGVLGVFALMFAETLFPPIPSEIVMPLAGFVAARGGMSMAGAILAGTLGSVVGNAIWYEVARRIGAARVERMLDRYGRWAALDAAAMKRAERLLRRHGPAVLLGARLLPGLRTVISLPAGLARIPRLAFYGWTILGSAVWVALLAGAGWLLQDQYARVEGWIEPLGWAVLALLLGAYLRHLWRTRRRAAAG